MVRRYKNTLFCDVHVPDSFCAGEQDSAFRCINQFFSGNICRINGIKAEYSKPFRELPQRHLCNKTYLICSIHCSINWKFCAFYCKNRNRLNKSVSLVFAFSYAQREGASGMIKFLAGSCLGGLGTILKEPSAIYLYGLKSLLEQKPYE